MKKKKIKKRLGAVVKPKNRSKKTPAKKPKIRDKDIKPVEVNSVIHRQSVQEDEKMKSDDDTDTTVIALVVFSLLISFAYTTCFHFLHQFLTNTTDEIKEIPANDTPVESIDHTLNSKSEPGGVRYQTYVELEKRLTAVERLVEGYKGVDLDYPKYIERLKATKPVLEDIIINSNDLTYSMYNRISSHEYMVEDIVNINQEYEKLDQRLKSVESVTKEIPIESMKQTYSELEKKLETGHLLIKDARFAAWIPDVLQMGLDAKEFLVEGVESIDKVNATVDNLWKDVEATTTGIELRKTITNDQSNDFKPLQRKIRALRSLKIPRDCETISWASAAIGNKLSGVFQIFPKHYRFGLYAYCDLTTEGGRWTVFQRRMDGSVNFTRGWFEYVNGFGSVDGEFWMGLNNLHALTWGGRNHELRIDMEDWDGKKIYAKYSVFFVRGASYKYKVLINGYSGTAGDAFSYHNKMVFSTYDADNNVSEFDCGKLYGGGWWFLRCFKTFLNGHYYKGGRYGDPKIDSSDDGITWYYHKRTYYYSMKFVEMKIRIK